MKITLVQAESVVDAAKQATAALGLPPMSITVVDESGYLVAFARMDGTFLGAIDVAHRKAKTAAMFNTDSAVLGPNMYPGAAAYTLENSNGGLVGFGGGVVLKDGKGTVLGAIGVSGGSVGDDESVAQSAAATLIK